MLAAQTAVDGSGAYVALELVTGKLMGKQGSFVLQHQGTMRKNVPSMEVTVVPDSGTGDLTGISGAMRILIEGGKHAYEFTTRSRLLTFHQPRTLPRSALRRPACRLASSRRSFAPRLGRVGRLRFGTWVSASSAARSRSRAIDRFCDWLRRSVAVTVRPVGV